MRSWLSICMPGGQLKLARARAASAEVIKQAAFLVEDLNHAPLAVDDVKVSFGVEADSFGPEHPSRAVADFADGVSEGAGAIEHLHAEIHGVDYHQLLAIQAQLGWIIELAVAGAGLAKLLQHAALHVHHEDLVAQGVGDINALGGGIHRDAGGPLEVSFAAFQAADGAAVFAVGIEDENLAGLGIGDVDIVLRDRRPRTAALSMGSLSGIAAGDELIFLLA